jgi:hypothetical protein
VANTGQRDDFKVLVPGRDALQDRERPEPVAVTLHDQGGAGEGRQGGLVVWARSIGWRDGVSEQHQRLGRLERRETSAHASTKRPAHERDVLDAAFDQAISRSTKIVQLGREIATRPRT